MRSIILKNVDLGTKKIQVPVAILQSQKSGKSILITGGMDGDEYTGIEAAYKLIEIYSKKEFSGRLIIIPIVNIPGFESIVSLNPLDNKYPKYVFPGKQNGTATERLMHWLSSAYINSADIWIDLHSGAITEQLQPFVRIDKTNDTSYDKRALTILTALDSKIKIFHDYTRGSRAAKLAKQRCLYVVLESGRLGERNSTDIRRHVNWVETIVRTIDQRPLSTKKLQYYKKVSIYTAKRDGLWYPVYNKEKDIKKGQHLGTFFSVDKKKTQKIYAKEDGVFLWGKAVISCKKGDELIAMAYITISLFDK